jgi:hypothetical protein
MLDESSNHFLHAGSIQIEVFEPEYAAKHAWLVIGLRSWREILREFPGSLRDAR